MIRLTCTSCQAVLEIDDAFAGGVCRCQHCGTIQTVPKRGQAADAPGGTSKALYQNKARPGSGSVDTAGSGTGLDELGSVVTSSGLQSNRLKISTGPVSTARPAKFNPVLIGGAIVAVLLLITILIFMLKSKGATNDAGSGQRGNTPGKAQAAANFCGIPLSTSTVIYLLDNGQATEAYFGHLKEATYRSIRTLGPTRKFQIVFWSNADQPAFPADGPTFATDENIAAAQAKLDSETASGSTTIDQGLATAVAAQPGEIVLATGKYLDDGFAELVLAGLKGHSVIVHSVGLGLTEESPPLKTMAEQTGGRSVIVSEGELRDFAR